MKKTLALLALFLFVQGTVSAQLNTVTTAVPFLRISPDARSGGMGDLGIATSADANAVFWNPSKLVFAKNALQASATYTPWLKDIGVNNIALMCGAAYKKINANEAVYGSLRYFRMGEVQLTDFSGNLLNTIRPAEFAIDGGYARKIGTNLSMALSLRLINSKMVTGQLDGVQYKTGRSVSSDLSLFYNSSASDRNGLSLGLVLSNLGAKIGYTETGSKDFIPANLGLGAAYSRVLDNDHRLTFGLDLNKLLVPVSPLLTGTALADSLSLIDFRSQSVVSSWFKSFGANNGGIKSFQASMGVEYAYREFFFARSGFFYEDNTIGGRQYLSLGTGFRKDNLTAHLCYMFPTGASGIRNAQSNTLRIGLVFDLAGE